MSTTTGNPADVYMVKFCLKGSKSGGRVTGASDILADGAECVDCSRDDLQQYEEKVYARRLLVFGL